MKKSILISILSVYSILVLGQEYRPIEFLDYQPLWSRTSISEKIPIKVQGYLFSSNIGVRKEPIIKDNVQYNMYNIVEDWFNGYYIEALDLNTGTLIWDHSYFSKDLYQGRYASHLEVYGDSVEITIYKQTTSPFPSFWGESHPHYLVLSKINGTVLDSSFHISAEVNTKSLLIPFTIFSQNSGSDLIKSGNIYNYFQYIALTNLETGQSFLQYTRYNLDLLGRTIDSTVIMAPTMNQISANGVNRLKDDNLFGVYLAPTNVNGVFGTEYGFVWCDDNLNVKSSGNLNHIIHNNDHGRGFTYSSNEYFIFVSGVQIPTIEEEYKYIHLLDLNGILKEELDLRPLKLLSYDKYGLTTTVFYENGNPRILFSIFTYYDNIISFYKSDGNGDYKLVKKLNILSDTKDRISMSKMSFVENNVLCQFTYSDKKTGLDPLPSWNGWVMINGKDLDIQTTTSSPKIDGKGFINLSSNPVFNVLEINFDQNVSGQLKIFNNFGQLVIDQHIENLSEYKIALEQYASGIYYAQFLDKQGKTSTANFIKM